MLTTVRVDAVVVQKSNTQVVQHSWLMEEAESCQIILTFQDVWVSQRREVGGRVHWVLDLLSIEVEVTALRWSKCFKCFEHSELCVHINDKAVLHFHLRAVAAAFCPQACSPGGCGLKPKLNLGQEPTHSPPYTGTNITDRY